MLFIFGLVLLIVGAEILVRGSSKEAMLLGISPVTIGLTIVAFGTSAPEIAVSVFAAAKGESEMAFGNVVGSNICNIFLILGLAALITPLIVNQKLVRVDVPAMIAASVLASFLAWDGLIDRLDGTILTAGLILFLYLTVKTSEREPPEVVKEYKAHLLEIDSSRSRSHLKNWGLVIGGLILLVVGSDWLVDGAIALARVMGMSELVIGLTIVALGTSLPEIATSVVAGLRGERDIAVGNAIGSCIFNLFAVLGIASIIAPDGILSPQSSLDFDLPVMIAASIACLPIFFFGLRISRWEGGIFVAYYAAYIAYTVISATGHKAEDPFVTAMTFFFLPLTFLTLGIVLYFKTHREPTKA